MLSNKFKIHAIPRQLYEPLLKLSAAEQFQCESVSYLRDEATTDSLLIRFRKL